MVVGRCWVDLKQTRIDIVGWICSNLMYFAQFYNYVVLLNIPIMNSQCSQTSRADQGNCPSKTSLQENPNRRKNAKSTNEANPTDIKGAC